MVSGTKKPVNTCRFISTATQLFADQYYYIYNARLKCAREALIEQSRSRWPDAKNVPLEQLNASLGNADVFVIGTLFKVMPKQPSILRELESNEAVTVDPQARFISDEDSLVLHETDENVQVVGDIDIHSHVTGIPVSLLGHQLNNGAIFHVVDVCYAGLNLNIYEMPPKNSYRDSDKGEQIVIVSGLEFGFDSTLPKDRCLKVVEALKKLRNFISGQSPTGSQDINAKDVKKIIIAGNSVAPGYTKAKTELVGSGESKDGRTLNEVFRLFDTYLFTLAQSGAEIDLMPGKNDPASFLLPQQPFHPKILPKSGILENIHPRTNPLLIEYQDITILGTSGENVDAIRQHSNLEYSTTILKSTLEWGHIAPCAPDNLSCVPFKERDPFLIDFVPDIYFAGNQPEYIVTTYCTDTKSKIQLISVPSFVQSLSCVVIDTTSLECELVSFE